ncbi:MAG: hypothetical protein F6K22_22020 [Okeania sp. SIO2F4]|nr:hypothetical protein [Okeania sp. SIO2F4]
MSGDKRNDSLLGKQGSDTVRSGLGNHTIHAGKSYDLVRGENGNYFLKYNPSKAFILSI